MRRAIVLVALCVTAACGGGSPSAPTPAIPNVAGSYSGSSTFAFPELQRSMSCPATTSVTQSGATVNIAPLVLGGDCGNTSIPLGQTTIDTTGALAGGSATGNYYDSTCGGTYNWVASGGFFGRELRLSITYTSTACYNMNFTAVLSR